MTDEVVCSLGIHGNAMQCFTWCSYPKKTSKGAEITGLNRTDNIQQCF